MKLYQFVKKAVVAMCWRVEVFCADALLYMRVGLRRRWRRKPLYVGITGSAGKTTTNDLCQGVLGYKGSCHSTQASINDPKGVARTVAGVNAGHRYCVVEVSGGVGGNIDKSLRMFQPDIAVLTLIEREHIKSVDSLHLIASEKRKLVQALPASGTAVLNIDDPQVRSIGKELDRKIVWVGRDAQATVRLVEARSVWPAPMTMEIMHEGQAYTVRTSLHGTHLALSVLCAIGVGLAAGMTMDEVTTGVEKVAPAEGRMQIVDGGGQVTFVRDDWKAPLWSLHAPLEFMRDAQASRKVIIIGTLSDYSLSASRLYPKVASEALAAADLVVFVGDHALRALKVKNGTEQADRLKAFTTARDAADFLQQELRSGDLVLLKGSTKVDHLARFWLNRVETMACWRAKCGRNFFCNHCSLMTVPERPVQMHDASKLTDVIEADLSMPSTRPIIVGLGNDDKRYHQTRHNVGHMFVDWLVEQGVGDWCNFSLGSVCDVNLPDLQIRVFKPASQINNCGPFVKALFEHSGAAASNCIVVHDELDLGVGVVRMKDAGGDGGHRGVRSLILALESSDILRVRIGVRSDGDVRTARDMVHEKFSVEETALLQQSFAKALDTLRARCAGMDLASAS